MSANDSLPRALSLNVNKNNATDSGREKKKLHCLINRRGEIQAREERTSLTRCQREREMRTAIKQ